MRTLDAETLLQLLLRDNEFLTRRADKLVSGPDPVKLLSDDLVQAIAQLEREPHLLSNDAIEACFEPLLRNNNLHVDNRRAVWYAFSDFKECNRVGSGVLRLSDLLVLKLGGSFAVLAQVAARSTHSS